MSDTDFMQPIIEVVSNQITFINPRLGPHFLAAMDLLANDLDIGNYKPSDRCNAGLEQLAAVLEDLTEEASEEIVTEEVTKIEREDEIEDEIEDEDEEETINLEDEEEEEEDEEDFLA